MNISEFIQVKDLISVKSVGKASANFATLLVINEFTQETNPINVKNVGKPLVEVQV